MARRNLLEFVKFTMPEYRVNWHHELLCEYLQDFSDGKIKKLMVFIPPQHGKSELTSRRLPAYILGKFPNKKVGLSSYSADLARGFNRDVQRIIDSDEYGSVFPNTTLNKSNIRTSSKGNFVRNADIFEVVDHKGSMVTVGVGGSLTGKKIDIGIIDDPVKDAVEGSSITDQARKWDWYTKVFLTRMNNQAQQLITMTRWNNRDLCGRILAQMNKKNDWVVLKLPALKYGDTHPKDIRAEGEALWEDEHGLAKLLEFKDADPSGFHALYQQDPKPFKGGLVYSDWGIVEDSDFEAIDADVFYGLDFGFNNPTALVAMKIRDKNLYVKQVIYESGLVNDALAAMMRQKGVSRTSLVTADSNKPDSIQDLKRERFNMRAAKKGANSVYEGILKVKEYKMLVTRGSRYIIEELNVYRWKEDADGNALSEPVKANDHALDAIRYGLKGNQKQGGLLAFG